MDLKLRYRVTDADYTDILLGRTFPNKVKKMKSIIYFDKTLNESQKEAVNFSLENQVSDTWTTR